MNNQPEIDRLNALLEGRKEEYKFFGCTTSDREYDCEIKAKIRHLSLIS